MHLLQCVVSILQVPILQPQYSQACILELTYQHPSVVLVLSHHFKTKSNSLQVVSKMPFKSHLVVRPLINAWGSWIRLHCNSVIGFGFQFRFPCRVWAQQCLCREEGLKEHDCNSFNGTECFKSFNFIYAMHSDQLTYLHFASLVISEVMPNKPPSKYTTSTSGVSFSLYTNQPN